MLAKLRHLLGWTRNLFPVSAVLTFAFFASAVAETQSISDAQLKKINEIIAVKGNEVTINKMISGLLGATKNDDPVSSRALAVNDNQGGIHQIQPLPDGRGYIVGELHPNMAHVYWVNKDFVLVSALALMNGQPPTAMPIEEAQVGLGTELAYWASIADSY
jgi:hypothetical protein